MCLVDDMSGYILCRVDTMVERSAIKNVRKYARLIRARFPVKTVMLFGSYARGCQKPDSDIDVAVVLKEEPENVLATEAELYKLRRSIDLRIEPRLVDDTRDPSGFWQEILKYGRIVYPEE